MAVTAYTLDRVDRVLFFRKNAAGVPVQLPFDLVTLDGVDYYEPHAYVEVAANGKRKSGALSGAVFLPRNMPLPRPASGQNPDKYVVWSYYGI